MVSAELFIVSVVRTLAEVAGFFLLGQGVLHVLAGAARESNVIYQLFRIVTRPVVRMVRAITPKAIIDRHVPVVSFILVFGLWILLAYVRSLVCEANGLVCR